jgi:hypothetical protein
MQFKTLVLATLLAITSAAPLETRGGTPPTCTFGQYSCATKYNGIVCPVLGSLLTNFLTQHSNNVATVQTDLNYSRSACAHKIRTVAISEQFLTASTTRIGAWPLL